MAQKNKVSITTDQVSIRILVSNILGNYYHVLEKSAVGNALKSLGSSNCVGGINKGVDARDERPDTTDGQRLQRPY